MKKIKFEDLKHLDELVTFDIQKGICFTVRVDKAYIKDGIMTVEFLDSLNLPEGIKNKLEVPVDRLRSTDIYILDDEDFIMYGV